MKKLLVAMPAFNEEKVIGPVIKLIKKEGYKDILVVDDSSSDNTSQIALDEGATVVTHPMNRGAGAATATAIEYARRNDFTHLVMVDSDGQHDPKEISKLEKHSKNYNVVIGSRMFNTQGMPFQRIIANRIGSFITFFFFGKYITDTQSGFKIFDRKAIESIEITFDNYEFCSEVIGEISRNKLTFKEVPIRVIYTDYSLSKPGQRVTKGFRMIFRFMLKK